MDKWLEPFSYNKLCEHQYTPAGRDHPYYHVKAINWEKAALAMRAALERIGADPYDCLTIAKVTKELGIEPR